MHMYEFLIIVCFLLMLAVTVTIIHYRAIKLANEEIRNNILNKKFISVQEFEDDWIISKVGNQGVAGYKYNDGAGCYVILIFNSAVHSDDYTNYNDVYIGQSVNMCKRVHSHFNGKGNGDVYADIKYGKSVYVQFIPCSKGELNTREKELIRSFNATQSYNKTSGGAASW